jgi:hypothetical protein
MRDYGITNAAPYASAPAVGLAGDEYYNTTDKSLYVSDGTAWNKVGPGAGGPPSGGAGGDLTGSYPSPQLGAVLRAVDSNFVTWGTTAASTPRSRLIDYPATGPSTWLTYNAQQNGTQDDATKPSWWLGLSNDQFQLGRQAAGSTVYAARLTLDGSGNLVVPSNAALKVGSPVSAWLEGAQTSTNWSVNHPWTPQDTTKPSWLAQMDAGSSDRFVVFRRAANAAAGTVTQMLQLDNAGGLTLAGGLQITGGVNRPGNQFTLSGFWSASLPASWNSSVSGTWVKMASMNVSLTAGRYHLIIINPGWYCSGGTNTQQTYYVGYGFDNAVYTYCRFDSNTSSAIGLWAGPSALVWFEGSRPTGAHTYEVWVWRSANCTIQTPADAAGGIYVAEFA